MTMQRLEVIGQPGTLITAELISPGSINLAEAKQYLQGFVRLVDVPIFVNEELVSQVPLEQAVPAISDQLSRAAESGAHRPQPPSDGRYRNLG
ncbi:hypothetical protein RBU00_08670 [Rhizobium sp. AN63]|uniref:hypothetical protein n=1 Tax=Rhizobium sp. AN63 TaxID=3035210 RepID=UPI0027D43D2D|nr:hypothetical protein [Rhizobium sp. AN63]MDQ4406321.1 hypothetical protein [Rhizobium sp. AN63]